MSEGTVWGVSTDPAMAGYLAAVGGLDGDIVDLGDVALEMALLQVEDLDGDIRTRLGSLQQVAEVRKRYAERIAELNGYLRTAGPEGTDWVWIAEDRCEIENYEWDPEANGGEGGVVARHNNTGYLGDHFRATNSEGDTVLATRVEDALIRDPEFVEAMASGAPAPDGPREYKVTRDELQAEIERLQAKSEGFSSDSEIGMLQLNRLLTRRNQILQLASNVMSSQHQSSMGIINNIKV